MMATSPSQDGVDGTDSGEVWILTAEDAILLMIPPFQEILSFFFPFREALFLAGYNLFFKPRCASRGGEYTKKISLYAPTSRSLSYVKAHSSLQVLRECRFHRNRTLPSSPS